MIGTITTILSILAPLLVPLVRAWLAQRAAAAAAQQRQAGADAQQVEAQNAENARINAAADAGAAVSASDADGLRNGWYKDPDNRARK